MDQKKNAKGTVTISNADNRIRLRWRYQKERYSINLLQYNRQNLLEAKRIALNIETDIASGNFDFTLNRYKKQENFAEQNEVKNRIEAKTAFQNTSGECLSNHYKHWTIEYKNIELSKNLHYSGIYNMLKRWNAVPLKDFT